MEKILITCPFTGLSFEAVKFADGRIVSTNPLTGNDVTMKYNASCNRYMIDPQEFKHKPLLTLNEVCDMLDLSKARVSRLVNEGRLQSVRPGSTVYVTKDSVLKYRAYQNDLARGVFDGVRTD